MFVNEIRLLKNYPNPAKAEAMPNFEIELTLNIIKKIMMPWGRNVGSGSYDFFLPIGHIFSDNMFSLPVDPPVASTTGKAKKVPVAEKKFP